MPINFFQRLVPHVRVVPLLHMCVVVLAIWTAACECQWRLPLMRIGYQVMVNEFPAVVRSNSRKAKGRLPSKSRNCSKVAVRPRFASALISTQVVRMSTRSNIQTCRSSKEPPHSAPYPSPDTRRLHRSTPCEWESPVAGACRDACRTGADAAPGPAATTDPAWPRWRGANSGADRCRASGDLLHMRA
jgi:hypothetical protein